MKRLIRHLSAALCFSALVIASGSASAAPEPQPVVAQGTPQATALTAGPALWKVADEDTTIYLFGTVHALPKDTQWIDARIEGALGSADELVTEVNLADAKEAKASILALALLPEGRTLRDMMPERDRAAFERAVTGLGLPATAFDRFEPWYAAMMLSLLPLARDGITAESGVEAILEAKLPPERKRGALETVDYQLRLFDTLPNETQLSYLREVSEGAPEMRVQLARMIEQWLKGDADRLAMLLNEENSDPVLMERLLFERNRNWAQWIKGRLQQPGSVFMAVGAGHLAGPGSVQEVLARDGIVSMRVQ